MRTSSAQAAGGIWSDPSVDLTGLLPDEALLANAVTRLAHSYGMARGLIPGVKNVSQYVASAFGCGEKWGEVLCRRFGINPVSGATTWPIDSDC